MKEKLTILQINTTDNGGGTSNIVNNLFEAYDKKNINSLLALGYNHFTHNRKFQIPLHGFYPAKNKWEQFWFSLGEKLIPFIGKRRGANKLKNICHYIASPKAFCDTVKGAENFNFPGTWKIFDLIPQKPDIVHLHNLHGDYFDLQALPWISKIYPTVLTLHDAWLLGGHCAHSFDCTKWQTGCGNCPYPHRYQSIRKDSSAYNLKRKKEIYKKSKFYIITPCQWLMDKVNKSVLKHGIVESKVIYNGVDTTIFKPGNKKAARKKLYLPQSTSIILFVGKGIEINDYKDYPTLKATLATVSHQDPSSKLMLICLGGFNKKTITENIRENYKILHVPYISDQKQLTRYYQAADLLIQPSQADTFPTTILEALASGLPVIGTRIGGIPEQINELSFRIASNAVQDKYDQKITGMLYDRQNHEELKLKIIFLLKNKKIKHTMTKNAIEVAKNKFSLQQQVQKQIEFYRKIKECSTHTTLL